MHDPEAVDRELVSKATSFAVDLTETVRAVIGEHVHPFAVAGTDKGGNSRASLRQEPREGIRLTVAGQPLLRLNVRMHLQWDHAGRYLATDSSSYQLFAEGDQEPLLRYDFLRSPQDVPGAHLQVHAHRDSLAVAMARGGRASRRARKRADLLDRGTVVATMSDLHFPLGGARFRPCLEDLLEMLLDEFGVDAQPDARTALATGRRLWRLDQLGAAVRDAPVKAAETLRDLGYQVTTPVEGDPEERGDRLRAV